MKKFLLASWICILGQADASSLKERPELLKSGEVGIGRRIPGFAFTDIAGKSHRLADLGKPKATVIALTGTGCPLCLKFTPTLAALEKKYHPQGARFIFVNPNDSEGLGTLRQVVRTQGFKGPYVRDDRMLIPQLLGALTTTEVFVLDAAQTLVYRGAVDDQYGLGYTLEAPRANYLADALEALLSGASPKIEATSAPGCELFYGDLAVQSKKAPLTYHNRISRILQANCIECHREGGIAPMPLETYDEVEDYAGMIRKVVQRGIMPPWFAAPMESVGSGHWANDRSLSKAEKDDLLAWVKSGAPEGEANEAPLPRVFPDGWLIGKPDAIFEFPRPVPVKATGTMPYQHITVETDLPEDKWVQAIEVRPGNPSVVHHVIVSLRSGTGEIDERDGYWGVYVPGNSKLVYPEGYAKRLPKGAKMRFQMHYTPNGTATEDLTRIGLVFAKEPPRHEVKVKGIANGKIRIPPGAPNHREEANLQLPYNIRVLGFLPHMHLRGKAARYDVQTGEGTQTLLDIPQYDFNWQLLYQLAKPLNLQKGDTLQFAAWFDNSADNPANPDPTKTVRWGKQTEDEMHLGYIEYIVPGHKPGEPLPGTGRLNRAKAFFKRLDVNGDGAITKAEVRQRLPRNPNAAGPVFDRLDKDNDGKLSPDEFAGLQQLLRR